MATCANHPIKMATARCKCCNKPLCNDCKRVTDAGIYCSPECEAKTRQFAERVVDHSVTYKKKFFTKRTAKALFILLAVVGGVGAYFYVFQGIRTWDDFKGFWATLWEARRLLLP